MSTNDFQGGFLPAIIVWAEQGEDGLYPRAAAIQDYSDGQGLNILTSIPIDPKLSITTVESVGAELALELHQAAPNGVMKEQSEYEAVSRAVQNAALTLTTASKTRALFDEYVITLIGERGEALFRESRSLTAGDDLWGELFSHVKNADDEQSFGNFLRWDIGEAYANEFLFKHYAGCQDDFLNAAGDGLQRAWEADSAQTYRALEKFLPELIVEPGKYLNLGSFAEKGLKEIIQGKAQGRELGGVSLNDYAEKVMSAMHEAGEWETAFCTAHSLSEAKAQILKRAKETAKAEAEKRGEDPNALVFQEEADASVSVSKALLRQVRNMRSDNALPFVNEGMRDSIIQMANQNSEWPTISETEFSVESAARRALADKPLRRILDLGKSDGRFAEQLGEIVGKIQRGEEYGAACALVGYPENVLRSAVCQRIWDTAQQDLSEKERQRIWSDPEFERSMKMETSYDAVRKARGR